jgi:hypothetical protein
MSDQSETGSSRNPAWLHSGRGIGPQLKWQFGTDGPLTGLSYCRESGDLFVSDQAGTLYRLDRAGQIAAMTRLHHPVVVLDWSDDGSQGAIINSEGLILRFDRDLHVIHKITPPEECNALAVSPFGNHLVAALTTGLNLIFNERKRRTAQFETIRPLSFVEFCGTEPIIFGAAEHGLLCCYNLQGAEIWQQKNWSNVGKLCATGDGDLLYLASFAHGVQTLDGDGASVGSYILEGSVNRVDSSYEPQRLIVSTIERALFWLDADGELLWGTTISDDVVDVVCDPLGEWAICGLAEQGVYRLDWGGI